MTLYKGAKLNIVKTDESSKIISSEDWGQTLFEVIDYFVEPGGNHIVSMKVIR